MNNKYCMCVIYYHDKNNKYHKYYKFIYDCVIPNKKNYANRINVDFKILDADDTRFNRNVCE